MRKRWFYVANALVGFLFLGLIYAWSVFVGPLESEFGWIRSQTSLNFSICMAFFCLGGLLSGRLLKSKTPRQVMLLSAGFILVGFLLTSQIRSLLELYIFYGVLCGLGVGAGYNTLLSATLSWFPDRTGLVSGVLLMGFGFGGSLLGSVAVVIMEAVGWRGTFVALGTGLAFLILLMALNTKNAPAGQTDLGDRAKGERDFLPQEMLRDSTFYAYYSRGMLVASIGLAMLGNAVPFAYSIAQDSVVAATIGGLISIFNGLGRVVGGVVFDRIGSRRTLLIGIWGTALAISVLIFAAVRESIMILTAGYILGGFFYGSNVPCNAGFIDKVYGQRYFAMNLSILNTYVLFSSFVGPYITGLLFAWTGSYVAPYTMLLVMCCVGFVAHLRVKRHYIPTE
ncbi:MAG: MFS transporter [Synergistaceae bacterium]|jgi:OFA family oxalate/formate antiporter-like MFS transporter|nr:MFS transporter [Synergistaceae bacterium]